MGQSPADGPGRGELICASCNREQPVGTRFCPHDGTPLGPARKGDNDEVIPAVAHAAMAQRSNAVPSRGKICPTCGARFEGGAEFCGKDGTVLVLLN